MEPASAMPPAPSFHILPLPISHGTCFCNAASTIISYPAFAYFSWNLLLQRRRHDHFNHRLLS
jgi:hypothetical protein